MAGKVTLTEIETGVATLETLVVINALMDAEIAAERAAADRARNNKG